VGGGGARGVACGWRRRTEPKSKVDAWCSDFMSLSCDFIAAIESSAEIPRSLRPLSSRVTSSGAASVIVDEGLA